MLGTAFAIAAAIAAALLAVRSATTPRTAPAGAARLDHSAPPPPDPVPAAPRALIEEPASRTEDPPTMTAPALAVDHPTMALLTAGSPTSAALPVLYAPPRPAPTTTLPTPETSPTNGSPAQTIAGPIGISDDRPLDDVLASAFELAPARARPAVRLAVGIAALSFLFAVGTIVAVRSVTLLVDKMLH